MQNEISEVIRKGVALTQPGTIINPVEYENGGVDAREIWSVYDEFMKLEKEGQVTPVLQAYCPECKTNSGSVFETIGEIPTKITCPTCGKVYPGLCGAYVFYRKNGQTEGES